MCTSLTYNSQDGGHFLARTMDFAINFEASPIFIPRHYHFDLEFDKNGYETKYSFIGASRFVENYIFSDGFNEQGFSIAVLYFNPKAKYAETTEESKINFEASELVAWALGNACSVDDFAKKIPSMNVVNSKNKFLKINVPLHWIISDKTGKTAVLEITSTGYHLYDNEVGVMTNSPDFNWHLDNLAHYNHLQPTESKAKTYGKYVSKLDGPGFGMVGLPGDFTSASRFIRTTFIKSYMEPAVNITDGIRNISYILNSVNIPKGIKINSDGLSDYTQYTAIMDLTNNKYYFKTYDSLSFKEFTLSKELLEQAEVYQF
ncbi:choloylglycine hydrolase family protein [Lactococcus sp. S64]|uniref:choloylglycine hydrolase family protein n=1 Tax=Lactococcus sp. S64 TaxID=2767459 RepID=UPI0019064BEE|nr:choloylglycine hydrolase family protein [Lactococcus sp. S64]MBK0084417.1 choloylglycine hydrolase family protein [Lactococcus sp. S64]